QRLDGRRVSRPQIRALLRAAGEGDLRIMFPRLDGVAAWDDCCREVSACRTQLKAEGIETIAPPMGCIIDRPSAAVMAGDLLDHGAQLLAIDIEDLTRYALGLTSAAEAAPRIAEPAVQRLVSSILQTAIAHSVTVYLCGITVENYPLLPTYLALGIHNFCVEPAALLPLKKLLLKQ
ncbi:putative PEP-binding protein, partial [Gemmiger sp.]|uniref:putative PEP-binding protein n=1 Tax=Gemmiger sp. TaxID=2049027 RepID=UPI002A749AC8